MTKGWTDRRRKQQAAAIRKWKPWQNATGPKTDAGKARVSVNALKHGLNAVEIRALRRLLALQRHMLCRYNGGGD